MRNDDMKLVEKIVRAMDDKKASDIRVLSLKGLTEIADYFILAGGSSSVLVKTIAENIEEKLESENVFSLRKEGRNQGNWILLDYGHIVVHVFVQEEREYYELEKLWGDAEEIDIQEFLD